MDNREECSLAALLKQYDPVVSVQPERLAHLTAQIQSKIAMLEQQDNGSVSAWPVWAQLQWVGWPAGAVAVLWLGIVIGQTSMMADTTRVANVTPVTVPATQAVRLAGLSNPWDSWMREEQ
jgi:hypothetical protein